MTEQGINELAARRDEQWEEVIELCRRYGYLTQETGQSATIMKNASQIKTRGLDTELAPKLPADRQSQPFQCCIPGR